MGFELQNPVESAPTPASRRRTALRYYEWLILTGFAIALALQLWGAVRQWSITSDEINHVHAGYRYVTCGDFGWNPEHPPLLKMVAALPLLAMQVNDPIQNACGMPNDKGVDFHTGHDFVFANSERMLMMARAGASIFTFALLVVVWCTARKLFGMWTAIVASALLVFEPNILAHGALVTTDVPASFGFFAAVFGLYRYFENRIGFYLILAGITTGIALALKHSCVLLFPTFVAIAVLDPLLTGAEEKSRAKRVLGNLTAIVAMGLLAAGVLWMIYGLRFTARPNGQHAWVNERVAESHVLLGTRIIPILQRQRLLPEAYLNGFQDILVDPEVIPRPAFLFGHIYRGGRWFYFPVAALVKFSAITLIFAILAGFACRFWKRRRRELLFLTVPPMVFLIASCTSNLNMGIRHILPTLPFLILFGAAGVCALTSHRQARVIVCAGAIVLHALSSAHAYPNYISYSNEVWGGPAETYRYLADSNVDWGQAMKEAKVYLDRNPPKACWLIHAYNDTSQDYEIPCGETSEFKQEEPPQRLSGTIIITSNALDGMLSYTGGARTADIFRGLTPKAKLGGSALFVYEGDFDLSACLASYYATNAAKMLAYDAQSAKREAERAAVYDPRNHVAHFVMCLAADILGDHGSAERECTLTLQIVREDANVLADAPGIEEYMKSHGMRVLGH